MLLRSLTQLNFRNLQTHEFRPCVGLTAVTGRNGAGKSNLLEACYLGLSGELPGGKIAQNVRIGEEEAFVAAVVDHNEGSSRIEIGLAPGRKAMKLDGQRVRVIDIARVSTGVLITPEDADIVHGSPSRRRAYLDSLLARISPRYATLHRAYAKVLEQRNAALKAGFAGETLDVWTEPLAQYGQEIEQLRERALSRIAPLAREAHAAISGGQKELEVRLLSTFEGELLAALHAARQEERARGTTVTGPHRSDLALELDGHSAQAYASRGEARTVSLALRVAEFQLLEERHAEPPVLLLDDFTAELDPARRDYLLDLVGRTQQAIVTGTEPPERFDGLFEIDAGLLRAVETADGGSHGTT